MRGDGLPTTKEGWEEWRDTHFPARYRDRVVLPGRPNSGTATINVAKDPTKTVKVITEADREALGLPPASSRSAAQRANPQRRYW